ncbi:MAG: dephospho-CoA kinase [Desulfamplus sp.]|nr:dephospho-CoA kinase [Desulfamplus sp.]
MIEDNLKKFSKVEINIDEIKSRIRGCDNRVLVGLTGSIASGKSTVADMFREHGAVIIDFDILARKVVEPGTRGLLDIVNCFGSNILDETGYLDRKKLSGIIFKDPVKRRELERLIHPAIFESFCNEVTSITCHGQRVVIMAVIPLLIEMNLQSLFDKIVVVYLSSEIQLKRLMQRDKINESRATDMVKSQMPGDKKIAYADFLVDNSGDLENSSQQVKEIWKKLLIVPAI